MHKNFTFDPELQKEIKSRFYYMDENPLGRKRLFFENSGAPSVSRPVWRPRPVMNRFPTVPCGTMMFP